MNKENTNFEEATKVLLDELKNNLAALHKQYEVRGPAVDQRLFGQHSEPRRLPPGGTQCRRHVEVALILFVERRLPGPLVAAVSSLHHKEDM